MADYSKTDYVNQTTNPAAPEGLQQEAGRAQAGVRPTWFGGDYADQTSSWFGGRNNEGVNNGWDNAFTEKMFSSYDAWTKKVQESQEDKDPAKRLSMFDQFDPAKNENATGLALWDDPNGRFKVGDVIERGRVVRGQNVREVYGDSTGNLILGKFMFGAKEQQKFSANSDPEDKWATEVRKRTDEWTRAAEAAPTARQYQVDVEREQKGWQEGPAPEIAAGAGAIAAGALAAGGAVALGSSWLGPGALITGGLAAVAGGVAAWWNQDQITEQLARGTVQADRARARYGGDVAFASHVTNWGGTLLRTISPLSNAVQGSYDQLHGSVGDGESEFYSVNAEGQRNANGWWQASDIAASLGDSVLQFSSGVGVGAYMTLTGAHVVGQVGTMALTGLGSRGGEGGGLPKSAGFNERTGEWDEYEGSQWLAAVGSVGIDALQFGIAGGLARAGSASRAAFNVERAGMEAAELGVIKGGIARAGQAVRSATGFEAQAAGRYGTKIIGAQKFRFSDVTGEAISARVALSTVIVPSEGIGWIASTALARARVAASARSGGGGNLIGAMPAAMANRWVNPETMSRVAKAKGAYMPGADDYYRAAVELSEGSTFGHALLNGFAEGWEEGIQAVLEPVSFGESVRPGDVVSAYLYGLASGTGMSMGAKSQRATSPQQEEYRAKAAFMMRRGLKDLSTEQWKAVWDPASKEERRRMAILNPREAEKINATQGMLKELHKMDSLLGSSIPIAAINAQRTVLYEELKANRVDKEEYHILMPMGGGLVIGSNGQVDTTQWAPDEAVQSAQQVMTDLGMVWGGLDAQQTALNTAIEQAQKAHDAAIEAHLAATDPDAKQSYLLESEHLARNLQSFQADLQSFDGQRRVNDVISSALADVYTRYTQEKDPGRGGLLLDQLNALITSAYRGQWQGLAPADQELARRAVELRFARDPKQDSGSWLIMKPQASQVLSQLRQHNTTFMNQSRLKALGADHDGDQGVTQTRDYLPPEVLKQLRRGAQYNRTVTEEVPIYVKDDQGIVQTDDNGDPIVGGTYTTSRKTVMVDPADGHKALVDMYSDANHDLANPFRKGIVHQELDDLTGRIHAKYVIDHGIFTKDELNPLLLEFAKETVNYGHDAEQHLLDGLVNLDEEALLDLADTTNMPEVMWVKREIEIAYERIQRALSLNAASEAAPVSSGAPQTLPEEHAFQTDRATQEAATDGLTLSMMLEYTTTPVRQSQDLFYSPFYRAAVESMRTTPDGHLDPVRLNEFIKAFNDFGSGLTQSAVRDVANKNPIEDRVVSWLNEHLRLARQTDPTLASLQGPGALVMLANMAVVDIDVTNVNEYKIMDSQTTLLQLLLKKSLIIEEHKQRMAPEDSPIKRKIAKLKPLSKHGGPHSDTANRALMEVFQDVPLYRTVGRWGDAFGAQLTPRQLKMTLAGLNDDQRREQTAKWRRLTGYRSTGRQLPKHDPPYSLQEYGNGSGDVNGFTMLIDAIIATAQTDPEELERADRRSSDEFHAWHSNFRELRAQWEMANGERIGAEWEAQGFTGTQEERKQAFEAFVVRDMIERIEFLPTQIASILPAGATTALFRYDNGQVWSAAWLREMLTIEEPGKAELMLFLHGHFAELNAHQGKLKLDKAIEETRKAEKKAGKKRTELTPPQLINEVNPADLQSRFLQVVVKVMQEDPTGFELDQILRLAGESDDLDQFLEVFNDQPNWNGTRKRLLKYHDDVALYEPSTADVWSSGLPSQLQRDAITAASDKLARFLPLYAEARAQHVSETNLIGEMEAVLNKDRNSKTEAMGWLIKLERAMANSRMFGDQLGYAARDQFLAMVQKGVPHLQNKGAPDPRAEGVGTPQITDSTIGGYNSGFSQELSAQTMQDWNNVVANLTGTSDGPVRVQLDNGTVLEFDMSDTATVLRMLKDPVTRAFAWAVVFPTVRDVDQNNNVQHYRRISTARVDESAAALKQALTDATLGHLGPRTTTGRMTLAQANEFIALMDSGIRRKAQKGTAAERQALLEWGNQPMVAALSEYIAAYSHGPGRESIDEEAQRQELIINFATVMLSSGLLKDVDVERFKTLSHATMQAEFAGNRTSLDLLGIDPISLQALDAELMRVVQEDYRAKVLKATRDLARMERQRVLADKGQPNTYDPAAEKVLTDTLPTLDAKLKSYMGKPSYMDLLEELPPSVQAAIDMWTINVNAIDLNAVDPTDPDQVAKLKILSDSRVALLDYLNTNERITRLVEKDGPGLMHKVRLALDKDPMEIAKSNIIRPEQWLELGVLAGTIAISESGASTSSGVGLRPIKLKGEGGNLLRYYDRSYSSLIDIFFDPQVRSMSQQIAKLAKYDPPDMTFDKVFNQMHGLLLNDRKLGTWTDLVVGEHVKARTALLTSTVLGAIQRHGIAPPQWRDVLGAGWASYTPPRPQDISTAAFTVPHTNAKPGMFLDAVRDPVLYLKLEHHFVNGVTITPPNAAPIDVLLETTHEYPEETVVATGFKVFRSDRMQEQLEKLKEVHGEGDYLIEINYVDVDKKPHTPEHINSIFYDGSGRMGVSTMAPGPVADTIFGNGAINKQGQQTPLDAATKAGAAFWQIVTTALNDVKAIEKTGRPGKLADVLLKKSLEVWLKEYETGVMALGDNNAIYKLMKMRHIVQGKDAKGKTIRLWAEDVIGRETRGETLPFVGDYELVPLSESVLISLLGRSGERGTKSALTMPQLNPKEINKFPRLDDAWLEQVGLSRLGEVADWNNNYALASVGYLAPATTRTDGRGAAEDVEYEKRVLVWQGEEQRIVGNRTAVLDQLNLEGPNGSRVANRRRLQQMIRGERKASYLAALGVPYPEMTDMAAVPIADLLEKELEALIGDSTVRMVWVHDAEASPDPKRAVLGRASINNKFEDVKIGIHPVPPMYKDVVVIDLDKIYKMNNSNFQDSVDEAKQVVRAYADRGVYVVLGGQAAGDLRGTLALWMNTEETTYRPIAHGSHVFAPKRLAPGTSSVVQAMESKLLETRSYTAEEIELWMIDDRLGRYVSENGTVLDYEHLEQLRDRRIQGVLLPTQITSLRDDNTMYGLPARGTGEHDQWRELKDTLLPIIDDPEVQKHLFNLSGGNPEGIPIWRELPNGDVQDGVLDFYEALTRFRNHLRNGTDPLSEGQVLMPGDFYVALSPTKQPLLMRYGFQLPKTDRLLEQRGAPLGQTKPVDGELGLGICISINKLQDQQTVPPPMRINKVEGSKNGIRVVGEYELSVMSKGMLQGIAYKAGFRPMPPNLAFPQEAMSDNGMRILAGTSAQGFESKQARRDVIVNYRKAFALAGIDLREYMMEFFYGKKDRSDPAVFDEDWSKTMMILDAWSKLQPGTTTQEARSILSQNTMLAYAQMELNYIAQVINPNWTEADFVTRYRDDPDDPVGWIASSVLATLACPGMEVKHIVGTQGLLTLDSRFSSARVTELPPLLTEALANPAYPKVRETLINAMNTRLKPTRQRVDKNGDPEVDALGNPVKIPVYRLNPDFKFDVLMRDPQTGRDMLWEKTEIAMVVPLSYDKDAVTVSAAALEAKSDVSAHNVAVAAGALSAWTALDPKPQGSVSELEALFGNNRAVYFEDDTGSFYDIFGTVKAAVGHVNPWNRRLPGQQAYILDALNKRTAYEIALDKSSWKEVDRDKADRASLELLHALNLTQEHLPEVDTLVRQFLGRPGRAEQEGADVIDADTFTSAVKLMLGNVKDSIHPLEGGDVPLESETFWALVFDAQRGKAKPWAPVSKQKRRVKQSAETWEAWVDTLFGQLLTSQSPFHAMHGKDLDGFYHTYQGTTPTYLTMPLSMDTQVDLLLADKKTNEYFISLDQGTNTLWSSPQLLDTMIFTLDQLTGHDQAEVRLNDARDTPSHSFAEQIQRKKDWLEKQKLPRQNRTSVQDYAKTGATYQESGRNTHNFIVNLNHLQIMNRLFNPSLLVSAAFEVPAKNALEHFTNIVMGTQLSAGGNVIAKNAGRATKVANFAIGQANKIPGVELGEAAFHSKYSPEQIAMLRLLAVDMGSKTEWKAELFGEMLYKNLIREGQGRIGKKLEAGATMVARMTSDPSMGMLARSAALRYLEAALDYIETVDTSISVEQLVVNMRDPLWMKKKMPRAHQFGVNRVGAVRGTKQSWANKAAFGWIDRLERGTPAAQWLGFMVGVPFKFRRFNVGTFLTITGLNGFDQMFAMMRDQRPDNGIVGRLQAAMRGEVYTPEKMVDHSDVLEGVTLVRPFVKGGLTQTALMTVGMFAGSLDLGGEDDEAKRRRRMAQYLNGPLILDPRKAENDMLYADAIFLDSVPILDDIFRDEETGRSAILPHWIFRQFTSPMMGIQRFMSSGDTREIFWGFQDAISVVPYSVLSTWQDAKTTFALLNREAELSIAENPTDPDAQAAVAGLGITMVSVLEKALFENSFVNAVRNASDKYDRDPFVMPGLTPEGNIARGPDGLPLPTEALESYPVLDPETGEPTGEIKQAYAKRDEGGIGGALSHGYAENNLTYAILASLFTGQFNSKESTFKRSNMAVKERSVELPTTTRAQAEALIMSAYASTGGQEALTEDEIRRMLKHRYEQADITWEQEAIETQAKAMFAAQTGVGAMSLLDADGQEVITKAGAHSVYQGLLSGNVKWEDASLEGMHIPWEMRDQIAEEWLTELTQEGIDLGLGEEAAYYRTKRLWYGDQANPLVPGLQDILYDNRIPGDGTIKYRQLNMTYMIGPDGNPVATPFTRQNLWQAFGIPVPTVTPAAMTGMSKDELGKAVDDVLGINTGLHGLERLPFEKHEPPEDLLDKVFGKDYSPSGYKPRPFTRFPSRGGFGGGGGFFQRMQPLPNAATPRYDDIPFINTSTPYIRRARVERERVTSERGRLNQWQ